MWQLNKIRYQFFDFKIDSIVTHFNYKQIITHIESLLIYEKQVKKITAIFTECNGVISFDAYTMIQIYCMKNNWIIIIIK